MIFDASKFASSVPTCPCCGSEPVISDDMFDLARDMWDMAVDRDVETAKRLMGRIIRNVWGDPLSGLSSGDVKQKQLS